MDTHLLPVALHGHLTCAVYHFAWYKPVAYVDPNNINVVLGLDLYVI